MVWTMASMTWTVVVMKHALESPVSSTRVVSRCATPHQPKKTETAREMRFDDDDDGDEVSGEDEYKTVLRAKMTLLVVPMQFSACWRILPQKYRAFSEQWRL